MSSRARDELREINAQYIHNFITNDVENHARLLHPSFSAIRGDGSVVSRSEYLRDWATGFSADVIPYWDTRDESITVVGEVALVRSTNRFVVRRAGTETERVTTYTDTYVYADERWLCVQAQTTPVDPAHVPPDSTIVSVYMRGVLQQVVPSQG